MKQYVKDQIGVLVIISILVLFLFLVSRQQFWPLFILGLALMVTYGYLCRRVLLLPLDLLVGKKTETLYFSRMCNINNYELFSEDYYCEWRFYSSKGTVKVLVPVAMSMEESQNMDRPRTDQRVRVCYYKHSKILVSWENV